MQAEQVGQHGGWDLGAQLQQGGVAGGSCGDAQLAQAPDVTPWWIRHQLSMPGQRICQDRILDEAHATGGDVRALCDLFGLSVAGAYRDTLAVDRIVELPGRDGAAAH